MTAEEAEFAIVAGKGGVGRTTVAVALAMHAAARGQRVLLVDAAGSGETEARYRIAGPDRPGVEVLTLTPGAALDEYLRIYLKLPIAPSRLGPLARIFEYVSVAAPGVREILTIGKIGWEVRNGSWDKVVVDGPATGHVVELLSAPAAMAKLVPAGPLAQQTGWLSDLLAAPSTGVVVVSAPEELPVTETGELVERIGRETACRVSYLVANRVPAPIDDAGRAEADGLIRTGTAPLGAAVGLALRRDEVARSQLDRLTDLGYPVVVVPERVEAPVRAVLARLEEVGL